MQRRSVHGAKESAPPLWVSQNFLTSRKTIKHVLGKTSICLDDHVVEIGPGKGHITSELSAICGRVTAVEMDRALYSKLSCQFGGVPGLRLVSADFLNWPLPKKEPYKIFSNIPFAATTAIVRKIGLDASPPQEAWLFMERGAAARIGGLGRESLLSLCLKPRFDLGVIHRFRREDFHPKPSVDVVLFHMARKKESDIAPGDWSSYLRFVTDGVKNPEALFTRAFTKKQFVAARRAAGLEGNHAAPEMLYVQWLCLFRSYRGRVAAVGAPRSRDGESLPTLTPQIEPTTRPMPKT